jgi:hypothetical protein
MIKILGVWLPLAEMPEYGTGLDVSHRKAKGSDHATLVSHGKLTHPVKIKLRLWRDTTLGYKEGVRVGKDWFYEWEKIARLLIPEKLEKRGALSVEYPLMAANGCDSVIFTEIGPYHRAGGQFYTIELKGYDPRTVKDNKGSKKVVKQLDKIGSRAAPSPQRAAESASVPRVRWQQCRCPRRLPRRPRPSQCRQPRQVAPPPSNRSPTAKIKVDLIGGIG